MLLIEGGDLARGELLTVVYRQVRDLPAGTVIGIDTPDPAAAIDIPAWCHLTGHRYRPGGTAAAVYLTVAVAALSLAALTPIHEPVPRDTTPARP